jgi:hypothetical protein
MKRCNFLCCLCIFGSMAASAQEAKKPPAVNRDVFTYMAGFEQTRAAFEEKLFYNLPGTRILLQPGMPVTPSPANSYASRLAVKTAFGPALLLKVDSADVFDLSVQAMFYKQKKQDKANAVLPGELQKIAPLLLQLTDAGGTIKGTVQRQAKELLLYPGLGNMLQQGDEPQNKKPGACLNWILLDSSLKPYTTGGVYGFLKAREGGKINPLVKTGVTINHSGYFLVFLSNESPTLAAVFDNLVVKHSKISNRAASSFIITENNFNITTENNINLITEN